MVLKLYSVSDGPPSLAVRMALKYLGIDYQLIEVDFVAGFHMTDAYAEMNPQKEIPVLDDDGFYLSESNAILQYVADTYAKDDSFYPRDPKRRAIVNHRLAFNLSTYYKSIGEHVMLPIFFSYKRTPLSEKKVHIALHAFQKYLEKLNMKFAAGDTLTIADLQLITATLCLEAINFSLSSYPKVMEWYQRFKNDFPSLWEIADKGMKEIEGFNKNPPDLSHLKHPIHHFEK
ncbi:hypothetical protein RUM44_005356 [Polyplax serrata]|uniref:Uncharacterized protein n=1 Tax=Polyplax serrata TaxID=468196 RepID=A0ABR1AEL5_POLSC